MQEQHQKQVVSQKQDTPKPEKVQPERHTDLDNAPSSPDLSSTNSAATHTDEARSEAAEHGLYDPQNEHDACGVGFVAHIKGKKAHSIVEQGLKILDNLDHRGAVGADKLMGDGAGPAHSDSRRLLPRRDGPFRA